MAVAVAVTLRWCSLVLLAYEVSVDELVLGQIMQDPEMQQTLQRCAQQPGYLRHAMADPKIGPKIRLLSQAGIVQIHPQ